MNVEPVEAAGPSDPPVKERRDFLNELRRCWNAIPYKAVFGILLLAWVVLFHLLGNANLGYKPTPSLFGWLNHSYKNPDDEHGWLIPFVVLGLFWWKRNELLEVPKRHWWPATILVALGLGLHVVGYMIQQARVSVVGFFVGLFGLIGVVWGKHFLKASFFPFFLFGFCVPLAAVTGQLTFFLRMVVTTISVGISQTALGVDVIRKGTQIIDPQGTFLYDVAPACSGIRSLTALFALTTIFGFVTFRKTWKRLLMMSVTIPIAIAGNVFRILAVIISAEAFGQKAGLRVHDWAGYGIFIIALVVVLGLAHFLRENSPVEQNQ